MVELLPDWIAVGTYDGSTLCGHRQDHRFDPARRLAIDDADGVTVVARYLPEPGGCRTLEHLSSRPPS